jgi:hypothetical protein
MSSCKPPKRKFHNGFLLLSSAEIKPSLPPKVGEVTKSTRPVYTVPTTAISEEFSEKSEI